jgi:beta-phosphoglucomutase family hydrolase
MFQCGTFMQLDIPPGIFAGYIFDLDGTLIDSMPIHYRAWDETMRRAGLPHKLDEDLFYTLGGVSTRRVGELIAAHYGLQVDADKLFHDKEALYNSLQINAKVIAPTAEFARRAAATHPLAVASGGPRAIVRRSLELNGLASLFRVVVTADDVKHGKPAPDMFLLAAKLMNVPAKDCLVFEDAEPGFKAAAAAGMKLVKVPSRG